MANFLKYQWIGFLCLYWGLWFTGQKQFSQNISHLALFLVVVGISWFFIGKIARDNQFVAWSRHIIIHASISLLLLIMSEITCFLWVFTNDIKGVALESIVDYIVLTYGWQLIVVIIGLWFHRLKITLVD